MTILLDGKDTPTGVSIKQIHMAGEEFVVVFSPCCNTEFILYGTFGSKRWQCRGCGRIHRSSYDYRAIQLADTWDTCEENIKNFVAAWTDIPKKDVTVSIVWSDPE